LKVASYLANPHSPRFYGMSITDLLFEVTMVATERTSWWWNLWCAETCWRFANVWWTYFQHV